VPEEENDDRDGEVRVLAAGGAARPGTHLSIGRRAGALSGEADVAESGVPGFEVTTWYGVSAQNSPEQYTAFVENETAKWGEVIRAAGIKGE